MKEKYELVKFSNEGVVIDVRVSPEENTVWLTQKEMVELFCTTKQNISLHINRIFKDGELDYSVVKEFLTTASDGKSYIIKYYNPDMVISVGYRVISQRGVIFRK